MRHLYDRSHLNRTSSHRKALFSNLSEALFLHRRVITTLAKARQTRRFSERMITFARRGDVAARRHVLRYIRNREAIKKLFDELGPHFQHRDGGYTRIIKLGPRRGDGAPMAILELVGFDDAAAATTPKKESKSLLKAAQRASRTAKKAKETTEAAPEPEETEESTEDSDK